MNTNRHNCPGLATIVVDHVDCNACGASYDAERKDPCKGPSCCGECGCTDYRLVRVTTLR